MGNQVRHPDSADRGHLEVFTVHIKLAQAEQPMPTIKYEVAKQRIQSGKTDSHDDSHELKSGGLTESVHSESLP